METPLHVLILGGGFAGVFTARRLRHILPEADIELINLTNYFVFQPLLPEVASGTITARDAVTPLRSLLKGVKFRMAGIQHIDTDRQCVHVVQADKHHLVKVSYDHLVIACGLRTNLSLMPGIVEHGFMMKDLSDAYTLRNHIIQCLEYADMCDDPKLKEILLNFVVVGGGFSGVETAGEVLEMLHKTLKHYPGIRKKEVRLLLIHKGSRLLPELPASLGKYAQNKLEKYGTELLLNTTAMSATANAVYLEDGHSVPTATLILTIGTEASSIARTLPVELQHERIPADQYLRVKSLRNVWALGDAAMVPLGDDASAGYAPPTAQFAVREAKQLAENIAAQIRETNMQPFYLKPRGMMASVGYYRAVAEFFGMRFSGFHVWLLWRGFYLMMIPNLTTRIRIAIDWFLDYFLPRSIVQISQRPTNACKFQRFAEGDIIFQPGEINDGFYMVVSGALESWFVDPSNGEECRRILKPGDHWGERTLSTSHKTMSWLKAVEDSRVLVLQKDDFTHIRQSFRALDEYFNGLDESLYPHPLRKTTPIQKTV